MLIGLFIVLIICRECDDGWNSCFNYSVLLGYCCLVFLIIRVFVFFFCYEFLEG